MTDLSTKIATQQVAQKKNPTMRDLVQAQQPAIEAQLAGALNSGAFVRAALSSIQKDEKLQMASPESVLGAIMLAAQLKLEIGSALGHFYLTPRQESYKDANNNWQKKWVCLPIIGYQGLIELAYRTGRIEKIETLLVREGDKFDHGANSERGRFFDWKPADYEETRPWTGGVVTAKILGAGTIWAYMPKEKVLSRRPARTDRGPWIDHEEEMAKKTLVREVSPYLPKSTDLGRAIEADGNKVESIAGVHDLVVTRDEPETLIVEQSNAGLDPSDPAYVAAPGE